jgi:hypothetical protein
MIPFFKTFYFETHRVFFDVNFAQRFVELKRYSSSFSNSSIDDYFKTLRQLFIDQYPSSEQSEDPLQWKVSLQHSTLTAVFYFDFSNDQLEISTEFGYKPDKIILSKTNWEDFYSALNKNLDFDSSNAKDAEERAGVEAQESAQLVFSLCQDLVTSMVKYVNSTRFSDIKSFPEYGLKLDWRVDSSASKVPGSASQYELVDSEDSSVIYHPVSQAEKFIEFVGVIFPDETFDYSLSALDTFDDVSCDICYHAQSLSGGEREVYYTLMCCYFSETIRRNLGGFYDWNEELNEFVLVLGYPKCCLQIHYLGLIEFLFEDDVIPASLSFYQNIREILSSMQLGETKILEWEVT